MTNQAISSANVLFVESKVSSPMRSASTGTIDESVELSSPKSAAGTNYCLVIHVDFQAASSGSEQHTLFDELFSELESDPQQADALHDARKWVGSSFFDDGETLASLRLRAGLSQRELADACKMAQPHVSRYESGRHAPGLDVADAMAKALGVDLNTYLLAWRNTERLAARRLDER